MNALSRCLLCLSLLTFVTTALADDPAPQVLLDVAAPDLLRSVEANDTDLAMAAGDDGKPLLEVAYAASEKYPGISVYAAKADWDLSPYAVAKVTVTNPASHAVKVSLRLDSAGDWQTTPWSITGISLKPGQTTTLVAPLGLAHGQVAKNFDATEVIGLKLFVTTPGNAGTIRIGSIVVSGAALAADQDGAAGPVDSVLVDFADGFDPDVRVALHHAVSAELVDHEDGKALRLNMDDSHRWPGGMIVPPGGMAKPWDLSAFGGIEVDLHNSSDEKIKVGVRVDNPGADGQENCNTENTQLNPGQSKTVTVKFGYAYGHKPAFDLDRTNVIGVLVFASDVANPASLDVTAIRVIEPQDAPPGKTKTNEGNKAQSRLMQPGPAQTTIDFESDPGAYRLVDGPTLTTDTDQVITGTASLIADSRDKPATWYEFFFSKAGLLDPNYEYDVQLKYRVLSTEADAQFYAMARSKKAGWGRWDRNRTDFELPDAADPETVHTATMKLALAVHHDYELMLGVRGKVQVVIDDIDIQRGKPYKELDPDEQGIADIPADAETVATFDFESDTQQADTTSQSDHVIGGSASLLIDNVSDTEGWNTGFETSAGLLEPGYRYYIHLTQKTLDAVDAPGYAYVVIKQIGSEDELESIMWKRWRGEVGKTTQAYQKFDVTGDEPAILYVGVHKAGKIVVDDLVIKRVPLGKRPIETRQPLERSDANLVWSDEFDGDELDTTKWTREGDAPRRGGWWMRSAVDLDGQGHLALRFQKEGKRWASGAIVTKGKHEFRYGYYETRMKTSSQSGHWAGFWLFASSVNKFGNDGRDGTEIDIVELPWRDEDRVSNALHWDGYGLDHMSLGHTTIIPGINEGWHTYAVDWSEDGYIFFVDGVETWRTDAGGVCNVPLHILISDELGGPGSWAGDPADLDVAEDLPDYTLFDYVRVWQAPEDAK